MVFVSDVFHTCIWSNNGDELSKKISQLRCKFSGIWCYVNWWTVTDASGAGSSSEMSVTIYKSPCVIPHNLNLQYCYQPHTCKSFEYTWWQKSDLRTVFCETGSRLIFRKNSQLCCNSQIKSVTCEREVTGSSQTLSLFMLVFAPINLQPVGLYRSYRKTTFYKTVKTWTHHTIWQTLRKDSICET